MKHLITHPEVHRRMAIMAAKHGIRLHILTEGVLIHWLNKQEVLPDDAPFADIALINREANKLKTALDDLSNPAACIRRIQEASLNLETN